ncbi:MULTISPECIES: hypothetical protein [Saccharothrix]|uniref:hypothetical protein n=1 Tax=Saccharothrix TaxID=2071 RepID=UPI0013017D99|nr:hypothetical protein [Saccharothrix sp. CB00851]
MAALVIDCAPHGTKQVRMSRCAEPVDLAGRADGGADLAEWSVWLGGGRTGRPGRSGCAAVGLAWRSAG